MQLMHDQDLRGNLNARLGAGHVKNIISKIYVFK